MQNTEFRTGVINPVECVKEGFELIKSDYWLLFGITIVGALIGGVTMYILVGAMLCGMFIAYLKKVDGIPVAFDDLWKGMQFFAPGLIVTAFMIVPMIVFYFGVYISMFGVILVGAQMGESAVIPLIIVMGVIDLIFVIGLVCFHTLLMFAFPLIVDRQLGGIDSMKTSARAVWQNLGGVAGLIGVNFVLCIVGYLALCVGVYFVIPVIIAGNVVAYRRVFPSLNMRTGFNPPNSYQGQ